MKCWICEKDIFEVPITEYVTLHWKCLERLQMDIEHLSNLERER